MRVMQHSKVNVLTGSLDEWLQGREVPVIAVMKNYDMLGYLIYMDDSKAYPTLDWLNAKDFSITDKNCPNYWDERKWSFWKPYIKTMNGMNFDFRITYYYGPKAILDDPNFLFDVVENRKKALDFYYDNMANVY